MKTVTYGSKNVPYVICSDLQVNPDILLDQIVLSESLCADSPLYRQVGEITIKTIDANERRSRFIAPWWILRRIRSIVSQVVKEIPIHDLCQIEKIRWLHVTGSCLTYGDGDFFEEHNDALVNLYGERKLTFLYYMNKMPKRFSGGEFVLRHDDEKYTIVPEHGTLLIFPSQLAHEVHKTYVPSKRFEDGRFVLVGFIWEAGSLFRYIEVCIRKVIEPIVQTKLIVFLKHLRSYIVKYVSKQ